MRFLVSSNYAYLHQRAWAELRRFFEWRQLFNFDLHEARILIIKLPL